MNVKVSENVRFSPSTAYENGAHVKSCMLYKPGIGGGTIPGRADRVIMSFYTGSTSEYVDVSMSLQELYDLRGKLDDMLLAHPLPQSETTKISIFGANTK